MKKILSLLLVLTMVLSLCACGDKSDSDSLDYNSNSNQISNDTTVVTPDTTGSSAIEYTPEPTPEVVEPKEEEPFDLSVNNSETNALPEYEEMNLGYKMCLLGVYSTEEANQYKYWVELEDSWKEVYDKYGALLIEVIDAKDNCILNSSYENVSANRAESCIIYDEFSRNRYVNRDGFIVVLTEYKDGHFDTRSKFNNYAKMEDLAFLLHDIDLKSGAFKNAQILEVNCEKEELNFVKPIYSKDGLLMLGDDFYAVSGVRITDRNKMTELIISVDLKLIYAQNGLDKIELGDTFKFYDEKTMELGTFPEGSTVTAEITDVFGDDEGYYNFFVDLTVSNPNGFSNEFIDQFQWSTVEMEINGQTYCVDTY